MQTARQATLNEREFRYGLFGVGRCGCVHGQILIAQGQCLAAVGDENPEAIANAIRRLGLPGAPAFRSASEMAGAGGLDAVVIASHTKNHARDAEPLTGEFPNAVWGRMFHAKACHSPIDEGGNTAHVGFATPGGTICRLDLSRTHASGSLQKFHAESRRSLRERRKMCAGSRLPAADGRRRVHWSRHGDEAVRSSSPPLDVRPRKID